MMSPPSPSDPAIIRTGDLCIDPAGRGVWRGGQRLEIADLSLDLLLALVRAYPQPLDGDHLARAVWHQAMVSDETLAQRIALLRKGLGDQARQPRYIRTVRHRGYAWMVPVETGPVRGPDGRSGLARLAAGLAGLMLLAAGVWAGFAPAPCARAPSMAETEAGTTSPASVDNQIRLQRARNLLDLHRLEETDSAISLLETVHAEAPQDRAARLMLSFALTTRVTKFAALEGDLDRAEALARGLLEDDAQDATAWHALGYALDGRGQLDEALSAYSQAFTLNPQDAAALSSAAYLVRVRGRLHDALVLEARAMDQAGPTLYAPIQIATTLNLLDHPAAARWWARAETGGAGESVVLAERLTEELRRGRPADALAHLAAAPAALQSAPRLQTLAGLAHLMLDDRAAAETAFLEAGEMAQLERAALTASGTGGTAPVDTSLAEALRSGESWPDLRVRLAAVHAQAGDTDRAIGLIGAAIDLGWRDAAWIEHHPLLAPVLDHPDWPALSQRIRRELAAQHRLIDSDPVLASRLLTQN